MFTKLSRSTQTAGGGAEPDAHRKADRCKRSSKKGKVDVKRRLMTLQEVRDWVAEAVEHPDDAGRCKLEPRFTFKKMPVSNAVRTSSTDAAAVQRLVHAAIERTAVPALLMTANTMLAARLPREAKPVEFCGSMGFKSAILKELGSVPATAAIARCIDDVAAAFPYGDIDLSVHVDSAATLAVAQRVIDNAVCDIKMDLDRAMFDGGCCGLRDLDLGDEWWSPFSSDAFAKCRANCCQILPVDDETCVRVDTPVVLGVDRRMRYSPLYVSRNTSIRAGFTLTRLLLSVASKDGKRRVAVPLLDVSLSVSPKRPCCATVSFGCKAMAASAKSVCSHLEFMASGEGDPAKLEKRRVQLAVAREARRLFKSKGV
jgi:hypothetical protein